jgi:hypothetical protein
VLGTANAGNGHVRSSELCGDTDAKLFPHACAAGDIEYRTRLNDGREAVLSKQKRPRQISLTRA